MKNYVLEESELVHCRKIKIKMEKMGTHLFYSSPYKYWNDIGGVLTNSSIRAQIS